MLSPNSQSSCTVQGQCIRNHDTLDIYSLLQHYHFDCYCGTGVLPHTADTAIMVQCGVCKRWYHQRCISSLASVRIFPGERNYHFTCARCHPEATDSFAKNEKPWVEIARDVIYNINLQEQKKGVSNSDVSGANSSPAGAGNIVRFFPFRNAICKFIDSHWDDGICCGKALTRTWRNTVASRMSRNPHVFRSNGNGLWTLQPPREQTRKYPPKLATKQKYTYSEDFATEVDRPSVIMAESPISLSDRSQIAMATIVANEDECLPSPLPRASVEFVPPQTRRLSEASTAICSEDLSEAAPFIVFKPIAVRVKEKFVSGEEMTGTNEFFITRPIPIKPNGDSFEQSPIVHSSLPCMDVDHASAFGPFVFKMDRP
jgi:hypothetical protein